MIRMNSLLLAAPLALLTSAALAEEPHSDVEIVVESGALVVEPTAEGLHVYEGTFGEGLDPANFAAEPGFDAEIGVLNPGDDLAFNILDNLIYWDGASFAAVPAGHSLDLSLAIFNRNVSASSGFQAGFGLGVAEADGSLHQDIAFTLQGPGAPDALAIGAYGVLLEMTSSQYASSNPFVILLNYGLDDASYEAGVDAAQAFVPEPTSLLLLAAAGVLAIRRR
jgi:hypothetical protein